MKQLSVQEMERISGGLEKMTSDALAFLYGAGAVCCGILGGPAGIAVGWLLLGAAGAELTN